MRLTAKKSNKKLCDTASEFLFCFLNPLFFNHFVSVLIRVVGSFSNDNDDSNENGKKVIDLDKQTATLHVHHAFW